MMGFSFSVIRILLSGIIPVNSVIGISRSITFDLPADGGMVTTNASADLEMTYRSSDDK
jgi:hypothetical protein